MMGTKSTNSQPADCAAPVRDNKITDDIVSDAQKVLDAARLVQLGARAALVCQLTGLAKKDIARLYIRITGAPSPPGQVPFTDTWYLKTNRRMLDANLVWRLFYRMEPAGQGAAKVLIQVYDAYLGLTEVPSLSLSRAFFVPRLVIMDTWHEQACEHCTMPFIAPLEDGFTTCPVCIEYFNHRCRRCGIAIKHRTIGRRKGICDDCHERHKKGRKPIGYEVANGCPGL